MDLLSRTPPKADHRIPYGPGPQQFGDLWLPPGPGKAPLLVFLHGGWWKSEYDLAYAGHLCSALRKPRASPSGPSSTAASAPPAAAGPIPSRT